MGRTRFSGPVYGGKETLFSVVASVAGSTGGIGRTKVPAGEDWFITDVSLGRESTGVATLAIRVTDDSTVVSSLAIGSTAATSTVAALTADAGEDEGVKVAAGSQLAVAVSASTATGEVSVAISGFRRFLNP